MQRAAFLASQRKKELKAAYERADAAEKELQKDLVVLKSQRSKPASVASSKRDQVSQNG